MKNTINKIIAFIDRVLWASQMASLTSPTYWSRSTHGPETSPWISSARANDTAPRSEVHVTRNEVRTELQTLEYAEV